VQGRRLNTARRTITAGIVLTLTCQAHARSDDSAELAKKLSNPVADLISVPFQFNYNDGFSIRMSTP